MPPVRSLKNQYRGINAHLHSYWQDVRGWNNFHNAHVTYLYTAFRERLLPMGYTAEMEQSIQVRRIYEYSRQRKSDVMLLDPDPARYRQPYQHDAQVLTGTVLPLPVAMADNPIAEKPYRAIAIYERTSEDAGEPVAWVEVLSPSNKRLGSDNDTYLQKRADLLDAGIVFVELDYLHEMPPTLSHWHDYSASDPDSRAYRILVLEPRPEVPRGQASINEFDVDEPIPEVAIPLSGSDVLLFDFNAPYQKQFREAFYGAEHVDYREFPANFDRYSPADQRRIALRMLAVLEAARDGVDLDAAAPLPVKDLSLEEAVGAVEAVKQAG